MKNLIRIAFTFICLGLSASVSAGILTSIFDSSWTVMPVDTAGEDGQVGPGVGGQAFDAEYLFYKTSGSTLYLGLQTGFDVLDGQQKWTSGSRVYWAGDLALSFDGDNSTFEYGVNFGLETHDYNGPTTLVHGAGGAGLYENVVWNNDVYSGHTSSNPFAIASGDLLKSLSGSGAGGFRISDNAAASANGAAINYGDYEYYRWVSFDLAGTGLNLNSVNAHWTMNCGNDDIDGGFSVPEPSLLSLMGLGLLGLGFIRRRKAKA